MLSPLLITRTIPQVQIPLNNPTSSHHSTSPSPPSFSPRRMSPLPLLASSDNSASIYDEVVLRLQKLSIPAARAHSPADSDSYPWSVKQQQQDYVIDSFAPRRPPAYAYDMSPTSSSSASSESQGSALDAFVATRSRVLRVRPQSSADPHLET